MKNIFIRRESIQNEKRAPLVPNDVIHLINAGIKVVVQASENRIYSNNEYTQAGALITEDSWFDNKYSDYLIVGIKELDYLDKLNKHTHIYFSHSYKKQTGADIILKAFSESNSKIYDFEYFTNANNQRLIAFGYFAGVVGGLLGLAQYTNRCTSDYTSKNDISNLQHWSSIDYSRKCETILIKIAIVGVNGRCGKGVKKILDSQNIPYTAYGKTDTINALSEFDIVYNCIKLDDTYNKVWFDESSVFTKPIVIVDISCDYSKQNNPIKLYTQPTTWQNPVYKYNEYVDIIAIDNLPSLLPKESSDEFSHTFTELILNNNSHMWQKCLDTYNLAVNSLGSAV